MAQTTRTYNQGDILYFYWGYTNSIEEVKVGADGRCYMKSKETGELKSFSTLRDIQSRPHGSKPEDVMAQYYQKEAEQAHGEVMLLLRKFRKEHPEYPDTIEIKAIIKDC